METQPGLDEWLDAFHMKLDLGPNGDRRKIGVVVEVSVGSQVDAEVLVEEVRRSGFKSFGHGIQRERADAGTARVEGLAGVDVGVVPGIPAVNLQLRVFLRRARYGCQHQQAKDQRAGCTASF